MPRFDSSRINIFSFPFPSLRPQTSLQTLVHIRIKRITFQHKKLLFFVPKPQRERVQQVTMSMKRKVVALRWIIKSICEHNKAAWLTLLTRHVERARDTWREIGQASDHNHTLPIMCETVRCRHDVGHAFSHCFRPRDKFKSFGRKENQPKRVVTLRRDFFCFEANRAIRKVSCQFVSHILCHELQDTFTALQRELW